MKGKELKQAPVFQVELDKVRPLTFDFNALCELQEFYFDPFQAVAGLDAMNFKAMRAILYSSLVAGQMAEDETVLFDLSVNQVGQILGSLMTDQEAFAAIFEKLAEAVQAFFPEPEEDEDEVKGEDEKN
ncbi:hypothetical protein ABFY54_29035 [Priestia megaterium]|uniref:hypothetical protein n=1 Tax=Priestia megaterium TaxID=1404 RepID=UPI003D2679F5